VPDSRTRAGQLAASAPAVTRRVSPAGRRRSTERSPQGAANRTGQRHAGHGLPDRTMHTTNLIGGTRTRELGAGPR